MGTLKALKRTDIPLSEEQLNGCRQLLKIENPEPVDLLKNCKMYLTERATKFIEKNYNPIEILQKW